MSSKPEAAESCSAGYGQQPSAPTGCAEGSKSCGGFAALEIAGSLVTEQKMLPVRTKFLLGIGESVQGINVMISGYYLNPFLLETACIDPMYVGLMQAVQGCFDAVNDPIIGLLSDRTRTRWGRRRPWLLFGAPILALFYFGLWNALPNSVPQFWKFIYAVFMAMGVSVGFTCVQVQIGALVPELTDDYDERTSVSAWRLGMANLVGLVGALCHNEIVSLVPGDGGKGGYRLSAAIFAVVLWLFSWVTFAGVQERFDARQESRKRMSVIKELRAVVRNRAFICVSCCYFLGATAVALVQTNLLMFCRYMLHDATIIRRIIPCVQGTGFCFVPFWVYVTARLDKRCVYILGGNILFVSVSSIYFVTTEAAALGLAVVMGICLPIPYLIPYSMLPDVIDEDELRTGKRREGIFTGFFTIMLKMSVTGALTLTNFILKLVGYEAPEANCSLDQEQKAQTDSSPVQRQPEIVIQFIRSLCSWCPAVLFLAAAFCAWLCPITRKKQAAMVKLAAQARMDRASQGSNGSGDKPRDNAWDSKVLTDLINECVEKIDNNENKVPPSTSSKVGYSEGEEDSPEARSRRPCTTSSQGSSTCTANLEEQLARLPGCAMISEGGASPMSTQALPVATQADSITLPGTDAPGALAGMTGIVPGPGVDGAVIVNPGG